MIFFQHTYLKVGSRITVRNGIELTLDITDVSPVYFLNDAGLFMVWQQHRESFALHYPKLHLFCIVSVEQK